jgi:hypothetical protein
MKARILKNGRVAVTFTPMESARMGLVSANGVAGIKFTAITDEKPVKEKVFTKAELAQGLGWPCTAGCTRLLGTRKRASVHATLATLQLAGHLPR